MEKKRTGNLNSQVAGILSLKKKKPTPSKALVKNFLTFGDESQKTWDAPRISH